MKKILMTMIVPLSLIACNSGSTEKKEAPAAPAAETKPEAPNPYKEAALALIAKSDCLTCHKINETSTGPAYKDVAKKYEATDENVAMLAEKVIKGGKGNWGEVPMLAHPTLSKEDASTIVKYILSLRNN